MATEIERRFLVMSDEWRRYADAGVSIQQAYIAIEGLTVVRLRIAGTAATLTIKAVEDEDDLRTRREYEFGVPLADALDLMDDLQEQRTVRKIPTQTAARRADLGSGRVRRRERGARHRRSRADVAG
jgi:adenylate cyclase